MSYDLFDILDKYAREHKLLFEVRSYYEPDEYFFRFYNKDRSWGYCRVVSLDQINLLTVSPELITEEIIYNLEKEIEKCKLKLL